MTISSEIMEEELEEMLAALSDSEASLVNQALRHADSALYDTQEAREIACGKAAWEACIRIMHTRRENARLRWRLRCRYTP